MKDVRSREPVAVLVQGRTASGSEQCVNVLYHIPISVISTDTLAIERAEMNIVLYSLFSACVMCNEFVR